MRRGVFSTGERGRAIGSIGDDGSDQFATLSGMGAFFDATTERIFEESGKGILASL